ncbi:hypothetical protein [Ruegeria sp. PrR005]|uniref:Uncharacterized protein n=1 Tax=Ruegeria sp. PrR005 TaxID=2706882 RepID=A0A6B2NJW1_9RHOB|nr:hypothetical protein [Ruegeria sp. PrR005]NDW44276.1 hypothetical protein [Ruegeria sp. PrR005]
MTSFIVHIGDGKCGSTSIQKALYDAREGLRQQGIIYETASPKTGHFDLVTLSGANTRGDMEKQHQSAQETLKLIKSRANEAGVILLSAESFFMQHPQTILGILEKIAKPIERVDIISYVRTPAGMYLSLVQQTLKGNSEYSKPHEFLRPIDRKLADWKNSPFVHNLTVRLFDRKRLLAGDVVTDFTDILRKLTGNQNIHLKAETQNASISSEQLIALQDLREICLKHEDGKLHPMSNRLIAYFENLNKKELIGHPLQLSREAHATVAIKNSGIVQTLNKMFPDLKMPNPLQNIEIPAVPGWIHSNSVAAILKSSDAELAKSIKHLIPPLNLDLFVGIDPQASEALADLRKRFPDRADLIVNATRKYWKQEGCRTSINQLAELS